MRIIEEEQLDFDDVLIMPRRSSLNSRNEVNIFREFKYNKKSDEDYRNIIGIPVMCSAMGTIGTPKMAKILAKEGCFCALEKHTPVEELIKMYLELEALAEGDGYNSGDQIYCCRAFPCIGVKESLDGLTSLKNAVGDRVHGIMIDVPNGYCPALIKRIGEVRNLFPDAFIIAGNVVTPDMCQDIINAGATAVKVGIGNGSCCRTRVKTGVGRPQLSTLVECGDACHQMNAFCVCDGGCNNPGAVCKALGAGADIVMSGSMFAGTDEAEGETVEINGKLYKQYYGMSSHYAQQKHFGGIRAYSASEGMEKMIPCTGPVQGVLGDILGGIRSAMTYIGCREIKSFSKHTAFYKVRHQFNDVFERNTDMSSVNTCKDPPRVSPC